LQALTGVVEPYLLSLFASAAVSKYTLLYPWPPLSDVVGFYRTARVLSQRLGILTLIAVVGTIVNTAGFSYAQGRCCTRVHGRLSESSMFLN